MPLSFLHALLLLLLRTRSSEKTAAHAGYRPDVTKKSLEQGSFVYRKDRPISGGDKDLGECPRQSSQERNLGVGGRLHEGWAYLGVFLRKGDPKGSKEEACAEREQMILRNRCRNRCSVVTLLTERARGRFKTGVRGWCAGSEGICLVNALGEMGRKRCTSFANRNGHTPGLLPGSVDRRVSVDSRGSREKRVVG